jgi:nitroreductase
MLQAAVRAPDHGRLRPWRFIIIPEDKRAAFGELLAQSFCRREPAASPDALDRERAKALRAPMIVVVGAHVERGHKIPEIEQIASAAAAAENIMLAAHAQGYGAVWKTGAPAYDPEVRKALGLQDSAEILGFLYVGTRRAETPVPSRPAAETFTTVWAG